MVFARVYFDVTACPKLSSHLFNNFMVIIQVIDKQHTYAFYLLVHSSTLFVKWTSDNFRLKSAVSSFGSYLSDREQCVKIGNAQSASLPMYRGQGSIIGPVLFNIFINDIILKCTTIQMITHSHTQAHIYTQ